MMKPAWVFPNEESFLEAVEVCGKKLSTEQFEIDYATRSIKFDCIRSEEIYSVSMGSQRGSNVLKGNFPRVYSPRNIIKKNSSRNQTKFFALIAIVVDGFLLKAD